MTIADLISANLDDNDDDDDEDYDPEKEKNEEEEEEEYELDELDEEFDTENSIKDSEEIEELNDEQRKIKEDKFRQIVLQSVGKLGAQLPYSEDIVWLKRVLKMMSVSDSKELEWFPWGIPPTEPLKVSANSSDELEKNHALFVLELYDQISKNKN